MPAGNFSDVRILVVMMKDGGEDTLHRYLHRDTTLAQQLFDLRVGSLGFTPAEIAAATANHLNANWALHPSLAPLKPIWDAGQMAITHRVGGMWTDCNLHTTAEIRTSMGAFYNGPIRHPFQLGAHDWQQYASASQVTRDHVVGSTPYTIKQDGFLGRLAERFRDFTPDIVAPNTIPAFSPIGVQIGVNGQFANLAQQSAGGTRPIGIPTTNGRFNRNFANATRQNTALTFIDAIMAVETGEVRQELYRVTANAAKDAVGFFQPIVENVNTTFAVDASFATPTNPSGNTWQSQFRTAARIIEARATGVGMPRRIIIGLNQGGYDTHSTQGKTSGFLPTLLTQEAAAIVSFRNAMIALGMWNNVVVMDWSEFGRPTKENGSTGTDHGWARVATLWGGQVRGVGVGGSTGEFGVPVTSHSITPGVPGQGSHDITGGMAGAGSLIPFYSWEQYLDPVLRWLGADNSDIAVALPRRANFGASPNLLL